MSANSLPMIDRLEAPPATAGGFDLSESLIMPSAPPGFAGDVESRSRFDQEIKARILMVDDRPDKLLALSAILDSLGQDIVQATSGKEALRQLLKQDFAVILLDVSMPIMDGFETALLIRQRPRSEHTPIIFLTSISSSENHIARGYSLGAVDYLLAPIVPEVLRAKVSVFVDLHRQTELIKRQTEQLRRDVTARKEAEAQIYELNQRLERQIAALTAANHELEAFNYSIAHDLRTPLRSMSGFARALLDDESERLSPTGLDYSRRIAEAAKYMDCLLLDLLAYSRLTNADMPPSLLSLDQAVQEQLTVVEKELVERRFEVQVLSPLGTACAHLPTLRQILGNLISNSLKFTVPNRPPLLRIYTHHQQGSVRLWVEDNGLGISPEHHEKIFGLFQRLHDGRIYPGTGIGLALVRKGAERMGGKAGVESQLGEGSRFWVELPGGEEGTTDGTQDSAR